MLKKFTCIILSVLICLSMFTVCVGAEEEGTDTLQFNRDGSFKIMQVTDLQDTAHHVKKTNEYLKEVIADEKPDLIVLTGDNISDSVGRGFTRNHSIKKYGKPSILLCLFLKKSAFPLPLFSATTIRKVLFQRNSR